MCVQRGRRIVDTDIPLVDATRFVFARHSFSCAQTERAFGLHRTLFLKIVDADTNDVDSLFHASISMLPPVAAKRLWLERRRYRRVPVWRALEVALARPGGLAQCARARERRMRRNHERMLQQLRLIEQMNLSWPARFCL
jgi:hypothetical protein